VLLDGSRAVLSLVDRELSRTWQAAVLERQRLRVVIQPGLPEAAIGLCAAATAADGALGWLRATGRPIYAINPTAVARYRDRHTLARRRSDHGDAVVLANILRTDM
jgi:hypothetical protein